MRITEEEFQRLQAGKIVADDAPPRKKTGKFGNPKLTMRPRPRHAPGKMNKSEEKYSSYLDARKRMGEIIRWVFEPFKLRLADNTFYSPDFMVVTAEQIEIHEYKGHWEDDARVKIKVAAELFPEFQFIAARTDKTGSYQFEYFK